MLEVVRVFDSAILSRRKIPGVENLRPDLAGAVAEDLRPLSGHEPLAREIPNPSASRRSRRTRRLSGYNLSPFFKAWGLPLPQSVHDEINAFGLPLPPRDLTLVTDEDVLFFDSIEPY